jgi:hypothetical protein
MEQGKVANTYRNRFYYTGTMAATFIRFAFSKAVQNATINHTNQSNYFLDWFFAVSKPTRLLFSTKQNKERLQNKLTTALQRLVSSTEPPAVRLPALQRLVGRPSLKAVAEVGGSIEPPGGLTARVVRLMVRPPA